MRPSKTQTYVTSLQEPRVKSPVKRQTARVRILLVTHNWSFLQKAVEDLEPP